MVPSALQAAILLIAGTLVRKPLIGLARSYDEAAIRR